ncbi:hypothetical protein FKM82_025486 [Ascaphus truei]
MQPVQVLQETSQGGLSPRLGGSHQRMPLTGSSFPQLLSVGPEGLLRLTAHGQGTGHYCKTSRMLKERMAVHRSTIRKALLDQNADDDLKLLTVARHFKQHRHGLSSLKCMPIIQANLSTRGGDRDRLLLQLEAKAIHDLRTLSLMA